MEIAVTSYAPKGASPALGNLPITTFKGEEDCCWEHLVLFYCLPGASGLNLAGNNMDVPEKGLVLCLPRAHQLPTLLRQAAEKQLSFIQL